MIHICNGLCQKTQKMLVECGCWLCWRVTSRSSVGQAAFQLSSVPAGRTRHLRTPNPPTPGLLLACGFAILFFSLLKQTWRFEPRRYTKATASIFLIPQCFVILIKKTRNARYLPSLQLCLLAQRSILLPSESC